MEITDSSSNTSEESVSEFSYDSCHSFDAPSSSPLTLDFIISDDESHHDEMSISPETSDQVPQNLVTTSSNANTSVLMPCTQLEMFPIKIADLI